MSSEGKVCGSGPEHDHHHFQVKLVWGLLHIFLGVVRGRTVAQCKNGCGHWGQTNAHWVLSANRADAS
jgi:hypothetical protein